MKSLWTEYWIYWIYLLLSKAHVTDLFNKSWYFLMKQFLDMDGGSSENLRGGGGGDYYFSKAN
jgi:hypothetical protein